MLLDLPRGFLGDAESESKALDFLRRELCERWRAVLATPLERVLDPFGGTGTTAMVAKALGRTGISVDLSADYCRLAEWRTTNEQQIDRVRLKTWPHLKVKRRPRKQNKAQQSMFELAG